jgi:hypothetical protein
MMDKKMNLVMLVDDSLSGEGPEAINLEDTPAEVVRQICNWAFNAEKGQKFTVTFADWTDRQCAEALILGEYWGGHFDEAEYEKRMAEAAKL